MKISNEVKIGILATVTILAAIWGYKFLKGQNFLSSDQQFHAYYEYADQLDVSAPVFVKGLKVGTVSEISFEAGVEKGIRVDFLVDKKIKVHKNSTAFIMSTGLLGGKAIDLEIPGPCSEDDCAKSGDELKGKNRNLITSMLGKEDLENSITQLSEGFMRIIDSLDKTLSESETREGVGAMFRDVQNALKNISELTESLNHKFGDPGSNFNRTLDNVASITENIKKNNEKITGIMSNVEEISTELKNAKIGNTVEKVNATVDQTSTTLTTLENRLIEAKESIEGLNNIVGNLERGEGTLGKLIQSEELYDNLQRSGQNLELLLQDIRLNPERYIKVSVFGKKTDEYSKPEEDPAYE